MGRRGGKHGRGTRASFGRRAHRGRVVPSSAAGCHATRHPAAISTACGTRHASRRNPLLNRGMAVAPPQARRRVTRPRPRRRSLATALTHEGTSRRCISPTSSPAHSSLPQRSHRASLIVDDSLSLDGARRGVRGGHEDEPPRGLRARGEDRDRDGCGGRRAAVRTNGRRAVDTIASAATGRNRNEPRNAVVTHWSAGTRCPSMQVNVRSSETVAQQPAIYAGQ
jgi:hypothetical protein